MDESEYPLGPTTICVTRYFLFLKNKLVHPYLLFFFLPSLSFFSCLLSPLHLSRSLPVYQVHILWVLSLELLGSMTALSHHAATIVASVCGSSPKEPSLLAQSPMHFLSSCFKNTVLQTHLGTYLFLVLSLCVCTQVCVCVRSDDVLTVVYSRLCVRLYINNSSDVYQYCRWSWDKSSVKPDPIFPALAAMSLSQNLLDIPANHPAFCTCQPSCFLHKYHKIACSQSRRCVCSYFLEKSDHHFHAR